MLINIYSFIKLYKARLIQVLFLFLCLFWEINPIVKEVDNILVAKNTALVLSSEINESQPLDFMYYSHNPIKSGRIIGIKIGTYGRKLDCSARIVSSLGPITEWGICPVTDWGFLRLKTIRDFSIDNSSYQLETDAKQGAGFAVGRFHGNGGSNIELLELIPRRTLSEIGKWISQYPYWALPWLVLFVLFLKSCYFGRSRFSAIYTVALMCIGSWPYSGHDETAHITGLHWSGLVAAGKSKFEIEAAQRDFFPKVNQSLKAFRFEELHGIKLAAPESCPHAFLGRGCSYEPGSKTFGTYLVFWKLVGSPDVSSLSPVAFLTIGRAFNLGLFLLFSFLVVQFFPSNYSQSVIASLVLCGSFLGQIGSINPEQFGYYSALLGALFLVSIFEKNRALKLQFLLGFLVFGLLSFLADHSGILFIPTFILVGGLYFLSTQRSFNPSLAQSFSSKAVWGFLCLGLFSVLWFGLRFMYLNLPESFSDDIVRFTPLKPFQGFINHVYSLSFKDTCRSLSNFLESFIGSYTWGHDYYPSMLYITCYAVIFTGFLRALKVRKSFRFDLLSLTIGFYVLALLISMIAGGTFQETNIIKESFLKSRIYGPAVFPIFQLFILSLITIPDKYFALIKFLGLYLVTTWLFSIH